MINNMKHFEYRLHWAKISELKDPTTQFQQMKTFLVDYKALVNKNNATPEIKVQLLTTKKISSRVSYMG